MKKRCIAVLCLFTFSFLMFSDVIIKTTSHVLADAVHRTMVYEPLDGEREISEELKKKDYYAFLLLGNECLKTSYENGRMDAMMLVTVDRKTGKINMMSLLRDTYVTIPDGRHAKLNAVYKYCGMKVFYDLIEEYYGIRPDAYFMVGFDELEEVIDMLGGAEVLLTEQEATYLNSTNYISKKENRNVVPGKQLMNGNQVMGYVRVRKVPNAYGSYFDFGRTERQRYVLLDLYDKYIDGSISENVFIVRRIMESIHSDASEELIEAALYSIYSNEKQTIGSYRIPAAGECDDEAKADDGLDDVIEADWEKTRLRVHNIVYGLEEQ